MRKRTELIVSTLDEETLADARSELDRLKSRRREIDHTIASMESSAAFNSTDPNAIADGVLNRIKEMNAVMADLPIPALRAYLATVVEKVAVDLKTKNFEIRLLLPMSGNQNPEKSAENAMRLVGTSASSTAYETHPLPSLLMATIACRFQKASNTICYRCLRAA